jgi:galactitol-specific phosphotransferase system IIC component
MKDPGEALVEEVDDAEVQIQLPRWVTLLLGFVAIGLVPWILYLTLTLPSRHVTLHYDLAWTGFDVGLTASFAATAWASFRGSQWLVPLSAVTGTMLCCDAWFDIVTSQTGTEMWEAITEAALAELPLAALCAFIVYDAETFLAATVTRFRR